MSTSKWRRTPIEGGERDGQILWLDQQQKTHILNWFRMAGEGKNNGHVIIIAERYNIDDDGKAVYKSFSTTLRSWAKEAK